ncbi:hypothetical protein RFI_10951 [Reticulomyxa filosa]|uniref:Uncharacterized protein n=1 Tax=Reticulomyxa filosa TaxID=46433 RepID=X6NJU7_RETFI|nr:hypothetical protein RFI_10951 [Reticulomyxa filosa]|eukprot:ETO26188.1 hypothetical protein RFI_10951 [Reticulomyxa filosa]
MCLYIFIGVTIVPIWNKINNALIVMENRMYWWSCCDGKVVSLRNYQIVQDDPPSSLPLEEKQLETDSTRSTSHYPMQMVLQEVPFSTDSGDKEFLWTHIQTAKYCNLMPKKSGERTRTLVVCLTYGGIVYAGVVQCKEEHGSKSQPHLKLRRVELDYDALAIKDIDVVTCGTEEIEEWNDESDTDCRQKVYLITQGLLSPHRLFLLTIDGIYHTFFFFFVLKKKKKQQQMAVEMEMY